MNNFILFIWNLIFYIISNNRIIIKAVTKPWPGSQSVTVVDNKDYFGENLSGLYYEEIIINNASINNYLWAVKNDPSILYKLYWNGSVWSPYLENGWSNGKRLLFSNGEGSPDSEDLTKIKITDSIDDNYFNDIYICIERNNNDNDVSMLMVLLYKLDYYNNNNDITAYYEWDLTNKLPKVDANKGFEGITWISDSYLLLEGFMDLNTKNKYDPLRYSDHGLGLFLLALEGNSMIYAFALNYVTGDSVIINSFSSGELSISGLYFDSDVGQLWTQCSNNCNGIQHIFMITNGNFQSIEKYYPPTDMDSNYKNEGYTLVPETQCNTNTNTKYVYWSDDGNDNSHAIRQGTIQCGLIL